MKLWLLEPIELKYEHDEADGFIVRAGTESAARYLAATRAWGEGGDFWTDPERSSCVELQADGDAGVVLVSYNAG